MSQQKTTVGAKIPQSRKEQLTELAEHRSSEGEAVTVSDLLREQINELLETVPESEISESVQDSSTTPPSGDFDVSDTSQKSEESGGLYKSEPRLTFRNLKKMRVPFPNLPILTIRRFRHD